MNQKTVGRRSLGTVLALAALSIAGKVAAARPCECVKSKMCWATVLAVYRMNVHSALPVERSEGVLFDHCNPDLLGQLVGALARKKAG